MIVGTACELGDNPLAFSILNDTTEPVTVSILRDGEERDLGTDPRIESGERAAYSARDGFNEQEARYCTEDDIIVRYDNGTEIRVPAPVCADDEVRLSDHVDDL